MPGPSSLPVAAVRQVNLDGLGVHDLRPTTLSPHGQGAGDGRTRVTSLEGASRPIVPP